MSQEGRASINTAPPAVSDPNHDSSDIDKSGDLSLSVTKEDMQSESIMESESKTEEDERQEYLESILDTNYFIERVFLLTLDKDVAQDSNRPTRCVYLDDLCNKIEQHWLDTEVVTNAVFERLLLPTPSDHVITTRETRSHDTRTQSDAAEPLVIRYLYKCYVRLHQDTAGTEQKNYILAAMDKLSSAIINNAKTCLQTPDVIFWQNQRKQFLPVFMEEYHSSESQLMQDFFTKVAVAIDKNKQDGSLSDVFRNVLVEIQNRLKESTLGQSEVFTCMDVLLYFSRVECLAELMLDFNVPPHRSQQPSSGKAYQDTLFGSILSISCIPRDALRGQYQYFDNPWRQSKSDHDRTESSLWQPIATQNEKMYKVLFNLLKLSPSVKHRLLTWLGDCLQANQGKGQMVAHMIDPAILATMYAGDGFFLNLTSVLIQLCKKFSKSESPLLLNVAPEYCTVQWTPATGNIHVQALHKETPLIPREEESSSIDTDTQFGFITECFFMTHRCLNIGFHAAYENFIQLNRKMHRLRELHEDIQRNDMAAGNNITQQLKTQMEKGMTVYLSYKAALSEADLIQSGLKLHVATATLLTHLATADDDQLEFKPVTFPLREDACKKLSCMPEFVMENILDMILFCHSFKSGALEELGEDLGHFFTMIIVYMGNSSRMKNPHLRAKLAEILEALMPQFDNKPGMVIVPSYYRERLFKTHPLAEHITKNLLDVFVSIEMTGQSVEFEQKFNYRRPMYRIIEYIWGLEVHKEAFKELALLAEANIEATDPPLFYKFINFLVNDAIFLLDESLQHMAQIKEKQTQKDGVEWDDLSEEQKKEHEEMLRQLAMIVPFYNIMSQDTVNILEMLTKEIKTIFTHAVMVDRIANMLNIFLLHLVGSKRKELAVRNKDEYRFNPQLLVSTICQIYLNLGENDDFCRAVTNDGRSYSSNLFPLAQRVLQRIYKPPQMISEFTELSAKIKGVADIKHQEEEVQGEIPEEFLDALMDTLMSDPVTLPSSGQVVDRSNIAKCILNDQMDPFNRSPLSMDMVIPNTELRERIERWKADKRSNTSTVDDTE